MMVVINMDDKLVPFLWASFHPLIVLLATLIKKIKLLSLNMKY
jgi:hypothetical protein